MLSCCCVGLWRAQNASCSSLLGAPKQDAGTLGQRTRHCREVPTGQCRTVGTGVANPYRYLKYDGGDQVQVYWYRNRTAGGLDPMGMSQAMGDHVDMLRPP